MKNKIDSEGRVLSMGCLLYTSVFDVAQTDGKPIPELAAKELLSDVEGYQDMIRAVEAISPVPIELEEIAGDSKGYYDREAKRIAVQENMSESQTLKTMIHELSLIHISGNQDLL